MTHERTTHRTAGTQPRESASSDAPATDRRDGRDDATASHDVPSRSTDGSTGDHPNRKDGTWRGSKRRFISGLVGLAATGFLAGCAGTGESGDESPGEDENTTTGENSDGSGNTQFDGFFENVSNYDGVVDETGRDEVTVTVGSETNGGPYGFSPAAVRISPGTTVTFDWVSNTHNVAPTAQPEGADWEGHPEIVNEGTTYTHTFDTSGTYKYVCDPHRSMGMKGAIVVADE